MRSLEHTPTWAVATVLTVCVVVSWIFERSIHKLSSWLQKTNQNPLFRALEKMKQELMLLGFFSLLLTAASSLIFKICIDSKFYGGEFSPCISNVKNDGHSSVRRGLNSLSETDSETYPKIPELFLLDS